MSTAETKDPVDEVRDLLESEGAQGISVQDDQEQITVTAYVHPSSVTQLEHRVMILPVDWEFFSAESDEFSDMEIVSLDSTEAYEVREELSSEAE